MITAKIKILFILLTSCGVFAYFKYFKKDTLDPKIGLMIGAVFLVVGTIATNVIYSPSIFFETLLLRSDINYMIEKMFFVGYFFFLLSFMSLIDKIVNKNK